MSARLPTLRGSARLEQWKYPWRLGFADRALASLARAAESGFAHLVRPETRARFQFGCRIDSDWTPGSGYEITSPNAPGRALVDGTNVEVDPPLKLVQSFHAHWDDASHAHGPSRVTWEIEPVGDSCRLLVTHDELASDAPGALYGGWPMMLSGLKTYLETGTTLTTPGSLAYGGPRKDQH